MDAIQLAVFLAEAAVIVLAARSGRSRRELVVLAALMVAPLALFLFMVSDTVWAFEDFREAYWKAGFAVLQGPDALRPQLDRGLDGFVNLPILAYLFAPFALLPPKVGAFAFFLVGIGAVGLGWRILARAYDLGPRDSALSLLAIAAFGPIHYSAREGNISHLLIPLIAAGVVLVRGRRDFLAGLALGLAALIKLPLLLLGVFFFARGRWKVAAGGATICLAAGLLSLAVFGWEAHAIWLDRSILGYGHDPLSAFNAQSVAGTFLKFQRGAEGLYNWDPFALDPMGRMLALAINLALVSVLGWAVWRGWRDRLDPVRSAKAVEAEVMMAMVLACLLSPLSWTHYYSWLVPAGVFLLVKAGDGKRPWLAAVAALGWLLAMPPLFWRDNSEHGVWTVAANTHLLVGAVLIYGCLGAWRFTIRVPVAAPAAAPQPGEVIFSGRTTSSNSSLVT